MKTNHSFSATLFFLIVLSINLNSYGQNEKLSGEYFGLTPPTKEAELFAPNIISTGMYELNTIFSPDGNEVFFSVVIGPMQWLMIEMQQKNGVWTEPETAPFNGEYGGVDMYYSPDGNRLYFCSNRPRNGEKEIRKDFDIWYVNRTKDGWSEPINPGAPINSDAHEFYPSLAANGTMYFQSRRDGGFGKSDIYKSIPVNKKFESVEILPEPINSSESEGDVFIAPDESYIIVTAIRDHENYGSYDLYISFKNNDDTWGDLINLGPEVNSPGGENCQVLSPCGKYLFFTSRRYTPIENISKLNYQDILKMMTGPKNGIGDSYWIDARIIEELR